MLCRLGADVDRVFAILLYLHPFRGVLFSLFLQVQINTGGSYIVSYFTMQVVPISQQLLVGLGHPKYTGARTKYKSRFDFIFHLPRLNAYARSQHSRLADLPHLAAKVVKIAHTTCANSK